MTTDQKQQLEQEIKRIMAALADEKSKIGLNWDRHGLRYLPTALYIKLQDYKGGLAYTQWFEKDFPKDAAISTFFFEWSIILFMNGKVKDAERKAVKSYFVSTYIFDKFFGRPLKKVNKIENWNDAMLKEVEDLKHSSDKPELATFTKWLMELEESEKFKSIAERHIKAQVRWQNEKDKEMRHYLWRVDSQLLNEI